MGDLRVSGMYLYGACKVFERCLEGVWKGSVGCLLGTKEIVKVEIGCPESLKSSLLSEPISY